MNTALMKKIETFNHDMRCMRGLVWFCIIFTPTLILLIPFLLVQYFRAKGLSATPEIREALLKFSGLSRNEVKAAASEQSSDAQLARFFLNARTAKAYPWASLFIAILLIIVICAIKFA